MRVPSSAVLVIVALAGLLSCRFSEESSSTTSHNDAERIADESEDLEGYLVEKVVSASKGERISLDGVVVTYAPWTADFDFLSRLARKRDEHLPQILKDENAKLRSRIFQVDNLLLPEKIDYLPRNALKKPFEVLLSLNQPIDASELAVIVIDSYNTEDANLKWFHLKTVKNNRTKALFKLQHPTVQFFIVDSTYAEKHLGSPDEELESLQPAPSGDKSGDVPSKWTSLKLASNKSGFSNQAFAANEDGRICATWSDENKIYADYFDGSKWQVSSSVIADDSPGDPKAYISAQGKCTIAYPTKNSEAYTQLYVNTYSSGGFQSAETEAIPLPASGGDVKEFSITGAEGYGLLIAYSVEGSTENYLFTSVFSSATKKWTHLADQNTNLDPLPTGALVGDLQVGLTPTNIGIVLYTKSFTPSPAGCFLASNATGRWSVPEKASDALSDESMRSAGCRLVTTGKMPTVLSFSTSQKADLYTYQAESWVHTPLSTSGRNLSNLAAAPDGSGYISLVSHLTLTDYSQKNEVRYSRFKPKSEEVDLSRGTILFDDRIPENLYLAVPLYGNPVTVVYSLYGSNALYTVQKVDDEWFEPVWMQDEIEEANLFSSPTGAHVLQYSKVYESSIQILR